MSYYTCTKCNILKHETDFHVQRSLPKGRRSHCKECRKAERYDRYWKYKPNKEKRKETWLRYRYNLNISDYEKMLKQQNDRCAICLKKKKLCVDHCHKSGYVRGLLCRNCNSGLGQLNDCLKTIKNALKYLEK